MSHEVIGLLALAGTLLGTVVASTWRFSALAAKLLSAVQNLERKDGEMEARLKNLDMLPQLVLRVEHLERNHSLIPKIESRVIVVEQAVKFSKELRALRPGSRPDFDGEE
jgi:hypothetical protein